MSTHKTKMMRLGRGEGLVQKTKYRFLFTLLYSIIAKYGLPSLWSELFLVGVAFLLRTFLPNRPWTS